MVMRSGFVGQRSVEGARPGLGVEEEAREQQLTKALALLDGLVLSGEGDAVGDGTPGGDGRFVLGSRLSGVFNLTKDVGRVFGLGTVVELEKDRPAHIENGGIFFGCKFVLDSIKEGVPVVDLVDGVGIFIGCEFGWRTSLDQKLAAAPALAFAGLKVSGEARAVLIGCRQVSGTELVNNDTGIALRVSTIGCGTQSVQNGLGLVTDFGSVALSTEPPLPVQPPPPKPRVTERRRGKGPK